MFAGKKGQEALRRELPVWSIFMLVAFLVILSIIVTVVIQRILQGQG
ncbi:hypothetical protein GF351_00305 [Candidatus Woesearchaeota archaeon]|nr:hypothetical protein [Candidatus Woesearchaeota archaeon]